MFKEKGKNPTSFEVHKTILIGRSEVFAAMLSKKEMTEAKTSSTVITDINPDPLKEMLRFIYTDQVIIFVYIFRRGRGGGGKGGK